MKKFHLAKNPYYVFTLFLIIGLARCFQSIDKLPADPGFDRVREIRTEGAFSLFSQSLGYLDVSARIGPLISAMFSLRISALILSVTTVLFTAILGVVIVQAIFDQLNSRKLAMLCGLVFMLNPAASESTIGNHGSLKWPLLATLCVALSSQRFVYNHKFIVSGLIVIAGLSNPFAFTSLLVVFFNLLTSRRLSWNLYRVLVLLLFMTTMIQVFVWWSNGVGSRIYEDAMFRPWKGMGVFWWWIWLSPPLFAFGVLTACIVIKSREIAMRSFAIQIAVVSLALWAIVQWESGIKDSTAVATCALSSIALLVMVQSIQRDSLRSFFAVTITSFLSLSSILWFSSSWYLTESPNWTGEVSRMAEECEQLNTASPKVVILTNQIEFTCTEISKWD